MTRHTSIHAHYSANYLEPAASLAYRSHHHPHQPTHHQLSPHSQDRGLYSLSTGRYRTDLRSSADPMAGRHHGHGHSMRSATASSLQQQPATLGSNGGGGTSTRRRIPVACGRCRKRKIRCTGDPGDGNGCQNCKSARIAPGECVFLRVSSQPVEAGVTSSGLQIGALHGASQSTTNFHTSLGHSQPLSRPGSAHGSLSHYLNGAQDPYLSKAAPYTDPMGRFNVSDPALLGLTSRNNGYVDAMVSSAGEPSSASSSPSSTDLYAQAQQYPLLSSSEPHPLETSPHSHPHYIAHPQSETLRPWTSSSTNARYSQTPYYLDQDFPPINISAPPARSIPPSTSSVTTDSYTAGLFPAMASLSSSLPNNSNHSSQNSSSPSSSIDKSLPPPPPPKSDTYQSTPAYRSVFDPVAPSRPSSNSYALSGILTNGYATYPNGLDALGVAAAQGVHQQQDQTQQHAHQNGTSDKKEFEDTPRKLTTPAGGLDGHPVQ